MFTTDLVNLYNRNIFKTSLYIYIFQDEKCRLMRNLSLSMHITDRVISTRTQFVLKSKINKSVTLIEFFCCGISFERNFSYFINQRVWRKNSNICDWINKNILIKTAAENNNKPSGINSCIYICMDPNRF